MKPNSIFTRQPKSFWAQVKLISMELGYSNKSRNVSKDEAIKTHTLKDITERLIKLNLSVDHLVDSSGLATKEGQLLVDYFSYRAKILVEDVEPSLMNREQAAAEFNKLTRDFNYTVGIPLNKQKGEKKHTAYLTGLINVLTEKTLGNTNFNPNPTQLTVITKNEKPTRTLARRVDGAYPNIVNPLAIWEIKEYYGTTTFGSRVADGVYETMLDGYELEELRATEDIDVKHYLIIDDYNTWWKMGKSYLCRMSDMLHEGLVDEVIVGRQVVTRWPEVVKSWDKAATTSTVESREHLLQS